MADDDKGTKKEEPTGPSKFPDLKELGGMASKLFGDVKQSVTEIIADYKKKRPKEDAPTPPKTEKPQAEKTAKSEETPKAAKSAEKPADTKDDDQKDA